MQLAIQGHLALCNINFTQPAAILKSTTQLLASITSNLPKLGGCKSVAWVNSWFQCVAFFFTWIPFHTNWLWFLSITGRYRERLSWSSKQSYQGLCQVQCHSTLHDLQLEHEKLRRDKNDGTVPGEAIIKISVAFCVRQVEHLKGFLNNPFKCLVYVFVASGCQVE